MKAPTLTGLDISVFVQKNTCHIIRVPLRENSSESQVERGKKYQIVCANAQRQQCKNSLQRAILARKFTGRGDNGG
jgi:hypothetical protein